MLKKERSKVDDKWKALARQAATKNPNFKEPTSKISELFLKNVLNFLILIHLVPYVDTHIVGQNNGLFNGHIYFM